MDFAKNLIGSTGCSSNVANRQNSFTEGAIFVRNRTEIEMKNFKFQKHVSFSLVSLNEVRLNAKREYFARQQLCSVAAMKLQRAWLPRSAILNF